MADKKRSKAEQRRAQRRAQRKAARRSTPKPRSKPQRPKSRKKSRGRGPGLVRRTAGGVRRLFGAGRRATSHTAKQLPRRDRLRAKRRRARNHLLAVAALGVTTYLLVTSLSTATVVLWVLALIGCVLAFGRPSDAH